MILVIAVLFAHYPGLNATSEGGQGPAGGATIVDHLRSLAGDKTQGRAVGGAGIELAARYIAEAFKACGLRPGGADGSYFQELQATAAPLKTSVRTKNVIGVLAGSGSLASEYVVVGAHYDSAVPGPPSLVKSMRERHGGGKLAFRGADDNASGTAALIELGRQAALRNPGAEPRRGVVFIAFTGEEVGAAGSKHFVEHPTVPLGKITAMLNLDTIGRMKGGRVDVYGVMSGRGFHELLTETGRELHLEIVDEPRRGHVPTTSRAAGGSGIKVLLHGGLGIAYYTPFYRAGGGSRNPSLVVSDDVPFFRKGIPVLFFSTGRPGHTPDDTVDRLNIEGIRRVVEITQHLIEKLRHRPLRLAFEGMIPGEY